MKIYLDLNNFDFDGELNISDYLVSIKENFPVSDIFVDDLTLFKSNIISHFQLSKNNDQCETLIYFKIQKPNQSQIKKKFNKYFKKKTPEKLLKKKFKYQFFFDINFPWWSYRIRTEDDTSHKLIDPKHDDNVFGRLGNKNSDEIFYFPYSFLFRCSGLGPIDQYGFRDNDFSTNSDLKILFLGGSACWGYNVLQSESFPKLLENKLNIYQTKKKVTIYNYAQHSYLLNDQFIAFSLFYHKIKPDIVIMHDGFNDLQFGMITDNTLIRDKITYALTHEYLASNLFKKEKNTLTHGDSLKMKVINTPNQIIDAYYEQKITYKKMIEALGIKFYSSLQPFLFSKTNLSDYEKEYMTKYDIINSTYGEPYSSCKFVYDKISNENFHFDLNFHNEFKKFDENLFIDFCHLNRDGEKKISDIYFNFLKDKI